MRWQLPPWARRAYPVIAMPHSKSQTVRSSATHPTCGSCHGHTRQPGLFQRPTWSYVRDLAQSRTWSSGRQYPSTDSVVSPCCTQSMSMMLSFGSWATPHDGPCILAKSLRQHFQAREAVMKWNCGDDGHTKGSQGGDSLSHHCAGKAKSKSALRSTLLSCLPPTSPTRPGSGRCRDSLAPSQLRANTLHSTHGQDTTASNPPLDTSLDRGTILLARIGKHHLRQV